MWYVCDIEGRIKMTQLEEVLEMKRFGYTVHQISTLLGISKENVERMIENANVRLC